MNSKQLTIFSAIALILASIFSANPASAITTITYFHNDISGTPLLATDQAGNVVWKENYRPYGEKLTNQATSSNNKIWFTGKPYDSNTGLSYMGARYYNPQLGRFMGIDPKGFDPNNIHSFNRYAYANNNPYKFVDPDGNSAVSAIVFWVGGGALMGGGTAGVFNAGMQYLSGGSIQWGGLGGVKDAIGDGIVIGSILGPIMGAEVGAVRGTMKGGLTISEQSGILRNAATGKGNFGLGRATAAEADTLGQSWVGEGFKVSSDGKAWVSSDGLKVYRPPSPKPNSPYSTTGVQANFEQKLIPGGRPFSNGHLDITQ